MGRDRAAIGPGLFVDQILRDDCFEPGEMVEQKDLARIQIVFRIMNLDIDSQAVMQEGKGTDAPLIGGLVQLVMSLAPCCHVGPFFAGAERGYCSGKYLC